MEIKMALYLPRDAGASHGDLQREGRAVGEGREGGDADYEQFCLARFERQSPALQRRARAAQNL